ncbi:MAG: glycosyltransferase family 2 protein [Thermoanaerobaculia bacterium]|nr:glycosyltransferase family 2 protein [Thermoanaerobaculia bacterium]
MSTASTRSDVELVVLDLDGDEHLDRCLGSIAAQSRPVARLVVWDNGSRVPVEERLRGRAWPFELEIARSPENLGFTGGVNAALRLCREPFVGLVNNDVVLDPRWVEALRPMFDAEPRLAGAQGVIVAPDGSVDGAGIDVSDGTIRQALHGSPMSELALAGDPWGVSATAALYRREALRDVAAGGAVLREDLFAYYEDVELSARLRARGWTLALCGERLAVHTGSATAHRLGGRRLFLQTRNRYIVARAWPGAGRVGALLREDFARIARCAAALDPAGAATIARGIVAGTIGPSAR